MLSRSAAAVTVLTTLLLLAGLPAMADNPVAVGSVEMDSESGVPGILGDVDDSLEEKAAEDNADKERNWEPVIAPLPSRNSAFGWMLSVPASSRGARRRDGS